MKQVTQRLRDGRIDVVDVPAPELRAEGVLVDVRTTLLSAGTERKKVETGRRSLAGKARARPDEVRKVIEKARRDGLTDTVRAVRFRLDQPAQLGYSAAGVVLAAGRNVRDLRPGDRVACAGSGHAVHAEIDYVPANLAVPVPPQVDFDEAAFTTVGAIALHGVRQADVRIGERAAVVGLGLVGQLAGQIFRAAGCRVVGVDLSEELAARALELGAVDAAYPRATLGDRGLPDDASACDAVLIAAATPSSDPVALAARLCRDRGRVVVLGDVGVDVPRDAYYEKELELRTSRSYGPGRYDVFYEERGLDYPIGYVRWTERRNMAAFLDLVAARKVDVSSLVSERVPIDRAAEAYERLVAESSSPLGILIEYEPTPPVSRVAAPTPPHPAPLDRGRHLGVIGAGSFANRILIPAFRECGFTLDAVASATGVSARGTADRFRFRRTGTSQEILADADVGLVAIATRHDSHARLAATALRAGKAVFVEKPPALTEAELEDLRAARAEAGRPLVVGFNRRHAPLAKRLRRFIASARRPIDLLYRVNAGSLPADHWLNDPETGGGRLLGEGCHFVDFACWLLDALPPRVASTLHPDAGVPLAGAQSFSITLDFGDRSLATIAYTARGSPRLAKEHVEVHAGDESIVLHDFRSLAHFSGGRPRRVRARTTDKGHHDQVAAIRQLVDEGGELPGPDPLDTMAVTLAALRAAEEGRTIALA